MQIELSVPLAGNLLNQPPLAISASSGDFPVVWSFDKAMERGRGGHGGARGRGGRGRGGRGGGRGGRPEGGGDAFSRFRERKAQESARIVALKRRYRHELRKDGETEPSFDARKRRRPDEEDSGDEKAGDFAPSAPSAKRARSGPRHARDVFDDEDDIGGDGEPGGDSDADDGRAFDRIMKGGGDRKGKLSAPAPRRIVDDDESVSEHDEGTEVARSHEGGAGASAAQPSRGGRGRGGRGRGRGGYEGHGRGASAGSGPHGHHRFAGAAAEAIKRREEAAAAAAAREAAAAEKVAREKRRHDAKIAAAARTIKSGQPLMAGRLKGLLSKLESQLGGERSDRSSGAHFGAGARR